jgi:hypothetical protein
VNARYILTDDGSIFRALPFTHDTMNTRVGMVQLGSDGYWTWVDHRFKTGEAPTVIGDFETYDQARAARDELSS